MSLKIMMAGPGDMYLGINSRVKGEMRWWLNIAKILSKDINYEIGILGQANKVYRDKDHRIYFFNIYDFVKNQQTELDILFTMDIPKDCGIEENWMSETISKIKTKHIVYAPFFGSLDHQKCILKTVYPYFYRETDNKKTFCLPIPFGSTTELNRNNFNKKNAIWFSKNSHENPDYLLLSLKYAINTVKKSNGHLIIIDGHKLMEETYKDSNEVKELLRENKKYVWWNPEKEWLSYDKMKKALDSSKFITGIHHPVCNPMSIEIVFHGGIPIIFQNQKELPPYDKAHIPFIDFNLLNFEEVYYYLEDPNYYESFLEACKCTAVNYSDENFLREWNKFLEIIDE